MGSFSPFLPSLLMGGGAVCQGRALEMTSLVSTQHPRPSEVGGWEEWPPCSLGPQLASWGRREGSISSPSLSHVLHLELTCTEALR